MNPAAVASALAGALCYCLAATAQHRVAQQEEPARVLDPRLLLRLARHPWWIAAVVLDLVGAGLHGAALTWAPLSLVQPLLVTVPIFAVPLDAAVDRRRPGRRDIAGVLLAGAGLATFVVVARPQAGPVAPRAVHLFPVVVAVAIIIGVLVVLALHHDGFDHHVRSTLLGIAAGAGFGVSATLAKATINEFVTDGAAVFVDWNLYALAIFGIASIVLNQNAYQVGSLAGPLTGIVLTDPLTSIAVAVTAYQEKLSGAWPLLVLALLIMAAGVWLVSTTRHRPPR